MAGKQRMHRCAWCEQPCVALRGQVCWACLDWLDVELFDDDPVDRVPIVAQSADDRLRLLEGPPAADAASEANR